MSKTRLIVTTLSLLFALGPLAFAQDSPASATDPTIERHAEMAGLVRTINTTEVTELTHYGSYAPWPILLAHHQQFFDSWLKQFYSSDDPNPRFSITSVLLPGWVLRLNVQADGKGYVLLLSDSNDKSGLAWVTDETGVIRECKYLR
jgi:hypothetical protein